MWWTANNYRLVFWIATIPGLLAVLVLVYGVREPDTSNPTVNGRKLDFKDIKKFTSAFWLVAGAGAIFQLARFSEAFLILRAKEMGLGLEFTPAILIVMNVVYALSSYPVGRFSDRIKREWFLLAGLLILLASDLVLATATELFSIFVGIAMWGLHLGLTQGTLAALVADHCPLEFRGTAYGLFNLLTACALLIASTLAGILWDSVGSQATFLTGAGFTAVSFGVYAFVTRPWAARNN